MTAVPLDHRTAAFETTEALVALGDAVAAPDATDAPLPGRYLAIAGAPVLWPISRAVTHIGRGFGATLQLDDASVSRRHAIVVERRGALRILDDRSANGVFVNGHRVAEAELHDGDTIQLGRVLLAYVEVATATGAQAA